jgi:hypothetical protein
MTRSNPRTPSKKDSGTEVQFAEGVSQPVLQAQDLRNRHMPHGLPGAEKWERTQKELSGKTNNRLATSQRDNRKENTTVCTTRIQYGQKNESLTRVRVVETRRQRLVIVGAVPWGEELAALLQRSDWDIFHLTDGGNLACAILSRRPQVVVLPLQTWEESGFLIAAKVRYARPKTRVLLIGTQADPRAARWAQFVGATYLSTEQGLSALVHEIQRNH